MTIYEIDNQYAIFDMERYSVMLDGGPCRHSKFGLLSLAPDKGSIFLRIYAAKNFIGVGLSAPVFETNAAPEVT
jgi:hypothetical protein